VDGLVMDSLVGHKRSNDEIAQNLSTTQEKIWLGSGSCVQAVHMAGTEDTFNKIKDANK
jgi:hypothetical protein